VSCWGDDGFGQLGDGSTTDSDRPVPVPGLPGAVVRVVAGAVHTCALVEDGEAFCWGQNAHGQLGSGTTRNASSPVAVAGGLTFQTLLAGGGMTCGFAQGGGEYCWGLNQAGQLGDGTRTNRLQPTPVGG
jgi:alpha-tubulin suppressor-like RCC1 family protein